jgi:predicted RNA-binding protein associated with RNAse of E/G family
MLVREIKRTLDGREQVFETEGLVSNSRLAIVRFEFLQDRRAGGFLFPRRGYTLGFFWAYRHYLLYRFCGPDGALIAHRFDIAARVRLRPGLVTYDDLAVDLWVSPGGETRVEDEDEMAVFVEQGKVGGRALALVERTKHLLLSQHARIVNEATNELAAIASSGIDRS